MAIGSGAGPSLHGIPPVRSLEGLLFLELSSQQRVDHWERESVRSSRHDIQVRMSLPSMKAVDWSTIL